MCGIAGIISNNPELVQANDIKKMIDRLAHRGPDGEGVWINKEGSIGMGHRRLAIIDPSALSAQPMHFLQRYTITYNGCIYNYREIKASLLKQGYSFATQSDTEVILAAYDCYQEKCLSLFDGMFAFAIWDEKEKVFFAARDRFGEKPFYYAQRQEAFYFASEMKALWSLGFSNKPEERMMLNYITLGYVQNPSNKSQTFYPGLLSLPPAHYLSYQLYNNKLETTAYFNIDKQYTQDISFEQASMHLAEMLESSIRLRLRSDMPIGFNLSGGLDSSTIVTLANEITKSSNNLKTFSAVFPEFEKDETSYIQQLISQTNVQNYTVTPTAEELIRDLIKISWHQEEPFPSSGIYAQYRILELARQHEIKVVLDGQGADESLAGYHKYIHWFLQEVLSHHRFGKFSKERKFLAENNIQIKWDIRNIIAAFLPSHVAIALEKAEYKRIINHPYINKSLILQSKGREWEGVDKPIITKLNDILYFNTMCNGLEELLRYADRNAAAHGIEARFPFLQHHLVSFIFSLPSSFKINNGFTKWILRKTMENKLPEKITWRTNKVGFEPPQKKWMEDKRLGDLIHECKRALVNNQLLIPEVLNKKVVPMNEHEANNFDWRYLSAGLLYSH